MNYELVINLTLLFEIFIYDTKSSLNINDLIANRYDHNILNKIFNFIKKQFDISTNKPKYYTNTNQYLTSRYKTQQQNEFNFLKSGNNTHVPGTAPALQNAYSPNGTFCSTDGTRPVVYYKPNNPEFAQQGAVVSSSYITRVKYNSITKCSNIYRQALGLSVANALAYGVSENGYTIKDVIGYPNTKTPVFQ